MRRRALALLLATALLPPGIAGAQPAAARDAFPAGRGTLLLESQQADGHWTTFASYQLRRPQAAATAAPGQ